MVIERRAFGERLKRHRERRGVTLRSIAESTKVAASLFEGLERGDCSRWPAGLYARSYVRSYAEAVGLNANETVEDFSAAFAPVLTSGDPAAPGARKAPAGSLRLSMAEDPAIVPERIARRAALAAADVVIGCLIVAIAQVGVGASAWVTAACVIGYFTAGRLVSDEPLLYWMFVRMRSASADTAPETEVKTEEVAVGDAARTPA